jgi:hypothetical protein
MIPGHVGASGSLWQGFKSSVEVEIGVLHLQSFTNSHKLCCTGSQASAFATICEQPLVLPHYCGSSEMPSIHLQPFMNSHFHFLVRQPASGPNK